MMAIYTSVITLANLILCGAVIVRLVAVLRRRPVLNASAQGQAWLSWAALVGATLASVLFNPFLHMGRYVGAIVAMVFVIWAYLCCGFAPHLCPKWSWPVYAGLFTIGVGEFYAWTITTGKITPLFVAPSSSPSIFLYLAFVLVIVARINLPALMWAHHHERQRPMRLRFLVMWVPQLAVAAWALASVAQHLALGIGYFFNFTPIYIFLMASFTITFIAAYLLPVSYFVRLAQALNYLAGLQTFVFIRLAEKRIVQLLGREALPIRKAEFLKTPEQSIYRTVIAILDARKSLKENTLPPQQVIAKLDAAACPQLSYPEVVEHLRQIGLEQLKFRVWDRNP